MPRRLTQKTKEYIRAHLDEQPRTQMAKKLGIKVSTLYKYIHLYGGSIKTQEQFNDLRAKIIAMFPTMTAREIAKELGVTISQVQCQATKLGLKHDKATAARINSERNSVLRNYWNADKYAKHGKRLHLLRKRDELLVMSGMQQNTKLHIRKLSAKALNAKMYLRKRYNYFYSKGEPLVLCFDKETRRCKREQHYIDSFGFQFIESSD